MISSLPFPNLRNPEFLQFHTQALGILELNKPSELLVRDQYDKLLAVRNDIANLFKTTQANPITETIQALDLRRDNAINGLLSTINGYTYHFDVVLAKHAATLATHLSIFGTGIAKSNFLSETATLESIATDWRNKPELSAAVAALRFGPWLNEMDEANVEFNKQYLARTQALGAANPETIENLRSVAVIAWVQLRDMLIAQYTINQGKDPFGKTVKELDALVVQYNTMLGTRSHLATKEVLATPDTPALADTISA